MKKYFFILLAVVSLGVSSCSPFQVKSDYSATANFADYKTYLLRTDDLKLNDIDKDRVLNELSKQLKAKNLSPDQNPDLIVNVKASHKKVQDVTTSYGGSFGWGNPWGWGGGFGVGNTWTNNYNSGTIIVDIIDAKTQKLVWQGVGSGLSVDSPAAKQREIPEIMAEIMKNYPPQKEK
ncbi:DUF4136 domain-containing protein [Chryseobacterium sp. SC28]|uniref:DUF4136 domain-containing protein n=1 Tax=Chryseobacterium sp. SC28 TaxID=2268028 RepID=UPI000F655B1A|nr:DUF4136 domain-containing protein [Chryseobacterium sp. SC28]RRQ45426.1 DUF4136 domain-containing protein [Chryseobacterium sp. SC28]